MEPAQLLRATRIGGEIHGPAHSSMLKIAGLPALAARRFDFSPSEAIIDGVPKNPRILGFGYITDPKQIAP